MVKKLVGGKITGISRICNLISIEISKSNEKIFLHIQSFFRILKSDKIILSSEDIYKKGLVCNVDFFEWDVVGQSLFDEELNKNREMLFAGKILRIKMESNGDLSIFFEYGLTLQIFIDTINDEEKYRIFDQNNAFVVNGRDNIFYS